MRKGRLKVVRELAQGHAASNMWNENFIQNFLTLEPEVLTIMCVFNVCFGIHTFHVRWVVLHVLRCAAYLGAFLEIDTNGKHQKINISISVADRNTGDPAAWQSAQPEFT